VFAGCGAIVTDAEYDGALGVVGIGLVFGLVIMVMVYATGHLSGAHINPAVTLAFALTRHFPARDAAAYVAAQLAGAVCAALLLLAVWPRPTRRARGHRAERRRGQRLRL
jgi:glycerol uptake facilitator-like aquaporin